MNSRFNDPAKVVMEGREPREVEKATGHDKLSAKLLDRVRDLNIGQKVVEAWHEGNAARAEELERQRAFLADWDDYLPGQQTGNYAGSSDLHLPMTYVVCRAIHSRLYQALYNGEPPMVLPRTEASADRAELVRNVMRYAVDSWANRNQGTQGVMDKVLWNFVTTGSGLWKLAWARKYERYVDLKPKLVPRVPDVVVDEEGNPRLTPRYDRVEEEQEVLRMCWEGPRVVERHREDVLVVGGDGDTQQAEMVIDREFVLASEVLDLADQGVFDQEAAERVVKSGDDRRGGSDESGIKDDRARNAGQSASDDQDVEGKREVLEAYLAVDVHEDGVPCQLVVWVHAKTREVLRACYLRSIAPEGERGIFNATFHQRPSASVGVGMVELMYPLSRELDAVHNMRVDFGLLSTMPVGFYRPNSSINPAVLQLEPGALIPVSDPKDVYFPNLGNRVTYGFQEEAGLMSFIERLTSLNDMSLGALTGAQGPTRTASGTRRLAAESNANLFMYFARFGRAYRQYLRALLHLLQRRLPPGLEFRVEGEHGDMFFATVPSRQHIYGDFDFDVEASSSLGGPFSEAEQADQAMALTSNVLDIQLGIITPANRYNALKTFYKSRGIKDFNKYVSAPQGYQYVPTPSEEINRVLRGVPVPVLPQMDHAGFIAAWQEIEGSDELLGQFDEQQVAELFRQVVRHQQMVEALQAQAAEGATKRMADVNASAGASGAVGAAQG